MEENIKKMLEIIRNNPNLSQIEKLVSICEKYFDVMNYEDENTRTLLNYIGTYLMQQKLGDFNAKDAIFMTKFLTKTCARQFGISDKVEVELLKQDEFEQKYGEGTIGNCNYDKKTNNSIVSYSAYGVVANLMSKDSSNIIRVLQMIGHEVTHAYQNYLIHGNGEKEPFDRTQYIMAMEDVLRKLDDNFYDDNYLTLYKENQADVQGLNYAIDIIKIMGKEDILEKNDLYIQELRKKCQERVYEHKRKEDELELSTIADTEMNARVYLDVYPELIEEYPILKIAFEKDGHKKNVTTLLNERKDMLKTRDKSDVDNLYSCILNETIIRGESKEVDEALENLPKELTGKTIKEEQEEIEAYIKNGNGADTFAKDLLVKRLERQGLNLQQIQEHMNNLEKEIEEKEQEKIRSHEESFRDEIGDKDRSKTEQEKQEEERIEVMWQSRFQSWDRDSINLPNGAKRKEEVVKVMQDIEKERRKQAEEKERQTENKQR